MATHRNLRKLSLWFKDANQQWIVASGNLLQNPQSKLKELDLDDNDIDDEGAIALANGLATNSTLKRLSLEENDDITNIGWLALAMSMLNPNSSIEQLNLSCKDIDDEAAAALANALVTSTKLKDLDLESNPSISNDGWRTFFNILQNSSNIALETKGGCTCKCITQREHAEV
jgi:Ran GTPase-activating protein (RanGAP) involved in mRNA processing and transport